MVTRTKNRQRIIDAGARGEDIYCHVSGDNATPLWNECARCCSYCDTGQCPSVPKCPKQVEPVCIWRLLTSERVMILTGMCDVTDIIGLEHGKSYIKKDNYLFWEDTE